MLENITVVDSDPVSDRRKRAEILSLVRKPSHSTRKKYQDMNTFGLLPILIFLEHNGYPYSLTCMDEFNHKEAKNSVKVFAGISRNATCTFTDPNTVIDYGMSYSYLLDIENVVAECFSAQMFASVRYGATVDVLKKHKSQKRIYNDCSSKVRSMFRDEGKRWKRDARFCHSNYIVPSTLPDYMKLETRKVVGQEITAWAYDLEHEIYLFQDHPSITAKEAGSEFERIINYLMSERKAA